MRDLGDVMEGLVLRADEEEHLVVVVVDVGIGQDIAGDIGHTVGNIGSRSHTVGNIGCNNLVVIAQQEVVLVQLVLVLVEMIALLVENHHHPQLEGMGVACLQGAEGEAVRAWEEAWHWDLSWTSGPCW